MSVWTELAKQAGAIALGAAGIAGTYLASRSTSREARHHARLEETYAEFLHLLANYGTRIRAVERGQGPRPDLRVKNVSEEIGRVMARLSLYGSRAVASEAERAVGAIERVIDLALTRPEGGRGDAQLEAQIVEAVSDMEPRIRAMTTAMRSDLAVPDRKPKRRGRD